MLVAGVDGCRGGWVVVVVEDGPYPHAESLSLAPDFAQMLELTSRCIAVGVDIPIGLQDREPRRADIEARRLLGGARASSVFPAPVRSTLACNDYREACEASFAVSGKRISRQLFGILPKIRETDAALSPELQQRVAEVHPEVSFRAMNDGITVAASKHTREGIEARAALIAAWLDEDLRRWPLPRSATSDDLLDACAVAWSASRLARGLEQRLPAAPQVDSRGLRMEIVY